MVSFQYVFKLPVLLLYLRSAFTWNGVFFTLLNLNFYLSNYVFHHFSFTFGWQDISLSKQLPGHMRPTGPYNGVPPLKPSCSHLSFSFPFLLFDCRSVDTVEYTLEVCGPILSLKYGAHVLSTDSRKH